VCVRHGACFRKRTGMKPPSRSMFGPLTPVEDGPGARASLISLSLHACAAAALFIFVRFSVPITPVKPVRVTMLHEGRLIAPVRPKPSVTPVDTDSGNRRPLLASKGVMPKPANLRIAASLRVQNLQPKLMVSPTLLDVDPPKIKQTFQYGNPLAQSWQPSPGPGFGGMGGGADAGLSGASANALRRGRSLGWGNAVYQNSELSKIPVLVYKVEPDYSDEARQARCHGTVVLGVIIDELGQPKHIRVLKPLGLGLDEKAMQAVERWRFSPGIKDGRPVCVAANVEVNFQLL
jgi:periplasmic protein TonB